MITVVEQVKQELMAPYKAVCLELGVPRSSLLRWKGRCAAGKAAVGRPGPAPTEPLNFKALQDQIRDLDHCRHRTHGTGALYDKHRKEISRRDFYALVEATRREAQQKELALERRVEWLVPGTVWSMDDTKKHWLEEDRFGHMHLVLDLGSRYNLRAMGAEEQADGGRVACNLEELFHRYGPPLFMKMDGGSNFKHHAVQALLSANWVIPLLSPPHYPPYNGSVEREHQEILRQLLAQIANKPITRNELRLECEVAGHRVNHMRRPCLGGQTACSALADGRLRLSHFGRRKRKEAFEQITTLAVDIAEQLEEHTASVSETAFRYAAETWMQSNNMIRVTRNGEVLPLFYQFGSH